MRKKKNAFEVFTEKFDRMKAAYGDELNLQLKATSYLLGDLIEIDEDLDKIVPLIKKLIAAEIPANGVRRTFLTIEARLFHTIRHMQELRRGVEAEYRYQQKVWGREEKEKEAKMSQARRKKRSVAKPAEG